MCIIPTGIGDVSKSEEIQLRIASPARSVQRQKNRPSQAPTNERDDDQYFEKTQKQEPIKRHMVKHIRIWQPPERLEPLEDAKRQSFRPFTGHISIWYGARRKGTHWSVRLLKKVRGEYTRGHLTRPIRKMARQMTV